MIDAGTAGHPLGFVAGSTLLTIAFAALLPFSATGQTSDQDSLETARQSALLWMEKSKALEKEIEGLRDQLDRLAVQPPVPKAQGAVAVPQPAFEAREEVEITIPTKTAVDLIHYGGPDIRVFVWQNYLGWAIVQIGSEGKRKLYYPLGGKILLHPDRRTGETVYLDRNFGQSEYVKLILSRPVAMR